jgi:recombination protein RecA
MEKKNLRIITSALSKLEKRFGESVVRKMSDDPIDVKTFSSGRPELDDALGGGYGVGKIIEIFAEAGCGKTGLCLEAAAEVQKGGGIVAIIDAEHALNTEYCEQIGISVDDLYISQPTFGEQAIEAIRALIDTGEVDLIIIDSVAALTPKSTLEAESGQAQMAVQARMMGQAMKQITAPASDNDCTVIFINQLRSTMAMYGPAQTTTGGKALKFFASQRLEIKNRGKLKVGEEVVGFKQEINIVKNKIGSPFKKVSYEIVYGKGIDKINGLIEGCVKQGILVRAGAWYKFEGENIAQGMKKLLVLLEDNEEFVLELQKLYDEKTSK